MTSTDGAGQHRICCAIIGAGGHARAMVAVLLEPQNERRYRAAAVIDAAPLRCEGERVLGVPILRDLADLEAEAADQPVAVFLGIGHNSKRGDAFESYRRRGNRLPNLVSQYAVVSPAASLGEANFVAPFAHVGPLAVLGNNNLINTHANVEHDAKLGDHNHVGPGAVMLGGAAMDDHCMLGSRSVLLEGTRIASRTTVGAGAVVNQPSARPGAVLVGVPARAIR